jgi:predicted GNAT family acetyltransferase
MTMTISITHIPERTRFEAVVDGLTSEIDYSVNGAVMTILHTGVPSALEGRGIAAELTRAAFAHAREKGWKIIPACSYADAYMRRHPEDANLRFAG